MRRPLGANEGIHWHGCTQDNAIRYPLTGQPGPSPTSPPPTRVATSRTAGCCKRLVEDISSWLQSARAFIQSSCASRGHECNNWRDQNFNAHAGHGDLPIRPARGACRATQHAANLPAAAPRCSERTPACRTRLLAPPLHLSVGPPLLATASSLVSLHPPLLATASTSIKNLHSLQEVVFVKHPRPASPRGQVKALIRPCQHDRDDVATARRAQARESFQGGR